MRKRWLSVFLMSLALSACTLSSRAEETPAGRATATAVAQAQPSSTSTVSVADELEPPTPPPQATATSPPTLVPTVTSMPTSPPPSGDLALSPEGVFLHPVPEIYEGDDVTFRILADVPATLQPNSVEVRVEVADLLSLQGSLSDRNLAGDAVALFPWAWNTEKVVGDYQVTVTVDPDDTIQTGDENPDNNQVIFTVSVLPVGSRPRHEFFQDWLTEQTECCVLHVISNTAAHRDLPQLKIAAESAAQEASERLAVTRREKIDLYFIDRVIGQGGYASSNMVISYLDRNYAGGGLHEVLVHEMAHLLDREFAPRRVPFLAEGLAVWAAGGHYKQEDIDQRVKALREENLYVPLRDLIDDFYAYQHEVGYQEAAGFINYLVKRYGWESVRAFYADVNPQSETSIAAAVEQALVRHFGLSLSEAEAAWLGNLDAIPRQPGTASDLLTTIRYYEVMRDYQLRYDPTAHFLQAWLPYPQELEQRQLTAEVSRHPQSEINVTLEVMLYDVDQSLKSGNYGRANVILDSVERAMANDGVFVDPLGANYREIVAKLTGLGFEVHRLELHGNEAQVHVSEGRRPSLQRFTMTLQNRDWVLIN